MKPRLIILVVAAAGLAVYFGIRASAPAPKEPPPFKEEISDGKREKILELQQTLRDRDLPGEEPEVPAEFDIQVEVDPTGEKNRLYFYLTEANGYYAETFDLHFFYKPAPDTEYDDSPLIVRMHLDSYMKANETAEGCIEIVPAELDDVGGDIGTSENWGAIVDQYDKARSADPDPLPPEEKAISCG